MSARFFFLPGTYRALTHFLSITCLTATVWAAPALAATEDGKPAAEADLVRALLTRVDQLEARVQALELEKAALAKQVAAAPPASPPPEPSPTAVTSLPGVAQDASGQMSMGPETPRLQMRGFSDIRYVASNLPGRTNSFALGQFNLFITSKLSERFSVLAEAVTEADSATNQFGIELERLQLNYHNSDRLNVSFGRYHSAIGFYNTAYHHSSWLQTTVDRPFLFAFEDGGGVLPIHNVGITMNGAIPSGSLGLHYVAEIGNGRATRTQFGQSPVQNVSDENNGKSFNFALFARPEAVRGLQFGASGYHDNLTPFAGSNVDEVILSAHVVYQAQKFEFMNEGILMRHAAANGSPTVNAPGFYSQISRQWKEFRPYFRYEYLNVPDRDLIFPDVRRMSGPLFGLRYNWGEYTAFKIQFQRTMRRLEPDYNTLTLQTSFAF